MNAPRLLYDLMKQGRPEGAHILFSQFTGHPGVKEDEKWWAKPLGNPEAMNEQANVYWTVSAFNKNPATDKYQRLKGCFAAGLALMIDDLGTGKGSKAPLSLIEPFPPTMLVETSPGNHQALYVFAEPVLDPEKFDMAIKALIAAKFIDALDPGMRGITRVFRPPVGVNKKLNDSTDLQSGLKYADERGRPFKVNAAAINPDMRPRLDEFIKAFGLKLVKPKPPAVRRKTAEQNEAEQEEDRFRQQRFAITKDWLERFGMLREPCWSKNGWWHVQCPWFLDHTGGMDNGAYIAEPNETNHWNGMFHCNHGHCEGKTIPEVFDWIAEQSADLCEMNNRSTK